MLGKLLKYDFAALSRILLPVHLAAIGVALVSCACFFFFLQVGGFSSSSQAPAATALSAICLVVGVLCAFTLGAAPIATTVVIIYRYYRHLFTDEGYLALTLPVTANMQVASKFLASSFWVFIDLAVVGAGFTGVAMSLASHDTAALHSMVSSLLQVFGGTQAVTSVIAFISFLVGQLVTILTAFLAFTLGALWAARHKVAAGVGLYLGITWIMGIASAIFTVILAVMFPDASTAFTAAGATSAVSYSLQMAVDVARLLLSVLSGVALYLITVYLLKNKVELA